MHCDHCFAPLIWSPSSGDKCDVSWRSDVRLRPIPSHCDVILCCFLFSRVCVDRYPRIKILVSHLRDPLVIVRKVSQLPVPSMYGLIGSTVDAIHQIFWHRWSAERWTWLETKSSEVSESSIFLRLTACLQRMSWVTPEFVARHCTESCKIAMRLSSLMHRRKDATLVIHLWPDGSNAIVQGVFISDI